MTCKCEDQLAQNTKHMYIKKKKEWESWKILVSDMFSGSKT